MIGNSKKILAVLLVGMVLVGGTAYAKGGPFTKFGRGLTNVLLSPAEIIYQPLNLAEDNNGVIAFLGGVPDGHVQRPFLFPGGRGDGLAPGGRGPLRPACAASRRARAR